MANSSPSLLSRARYTSAELHESLKYRGHQNFWHEGIGYWLPYGLNEGFDEEDGVNEWELYGAASWDKLRIRQRRQRRNEKKLLSMQEVISEDDEPSKCSATTSEPSHRKAKMKPNPNSKRTQKRVTRGFTPEEKLRRNRDARHRRTAQRRRWRDAQFNEWAAKYTPSGFDRVASWVEASTYSEEPRSLVQVDADLGLGDINERPACPSCPSENHFRTPRFGPRVALRPDEETPQSECDHQIWINQHNFYFVQTDPPIFEITAFPLWWFESSEDTFEWMDQLRSAFYEDSEVEYNNDWGDYDDDGNLYSTGDGATFRNDSTDLEGFKHSHHSTMRSSCQNAWLDWEDGWGPAQLSYENQCRNCGTHEWHFLDCSSAHSIFPPGSALRIGEPKSVIVIERFPDWWYSKDPCPGVRGEFGRDESLSWQYHPEVGRRPEYIDEDFQPGWCERKTEDERYPNLAEMTDEILMVPDSEVEDWKFVRELSAKDALEGATVKPMWVHPSVTAERARKEASQRKVGWLEADW